MQAEDTIYIKTLGNNEGFYIELTKMDGRTVSSKVPFLKDVMDEVFHLNELIKEMV